MHILFSILGFWSIFSICIVAFLRGAATPSNEEMPVSRHSGSASAETSLSAGLQVQH